MHINQTFHIEAPYGLINDPNGLSYFKGQYYIFFQWNPKALDHSYKEWGLITSKDLIHLSTPKRVLQPDQPYDRNGVYSGSGLVFHDQLYLYYTGNVKKDQQRCPSQCLAISEDGVHFEKKGVVLNQPAYVTGHFRDPKVTYDNGFSMVIGAQLRNKKGAILRYTSTKGREFAFQDQIGTSETYQMIECPDLFHLDGHNILLYGLQARDAKDECLESHCVYLIDHFTHLDHGEMVDAGFDFYAPQTLIDAQGRRIMIGWMSRLSDAQENILKKHAAHIHCLTMPRVLTLKNQHLYQQPLKEMYQLLGKQKSLQDQISRTFYLKLTQSEHFHLNINQEMKIHYDRGRFTLERYDWSQDNYETKEVKIDRFTNMEIWSDTSSFEVFLNDGAYVFSLRTLPRSETIKILFLGDGQPHIQELEVHK